jgi:hypothetical protein
MSYETRRRWTGQGNAIPPEMLCELLEYCPDTGLLTWKARTEKWFKSGYRTARGNAANWNAKHAGKTAAKRSPRGYVRIALLGAEYYAHRIAWAIHYGEWPRGEIDHVNHDPSDNRISNLREVSRTDNCKNQSMSSLNTSGVTGVCWDSRKKRWISHITVNNYRHRLGLFVQFDAAVKARRDAEKLYGFHPNHGAFK